MPDLEDTETTNGQRTLAEFPLGRLYEDAEGLRLELSPKETARAYADSLPPFFTRDHFGNVYSISHGTVPTDVPTPVTLVPVSPH